MTSKTIAESNIQEFLEKHGREGFLELFLTNYLFELVMYYLHSEKNPSAQIREDTSYTFYVGGRERAYSPEQIEKFKQNLRAECRKKAKVIVERLKKMKLLERLPKDIMAEPEVAKLVQNAFRSITKRT